MLSLMTNCCDDVLSFYGSFISRCVWARMVCVWIRWWNVANTMRSQGEVRIITMPMVLDVLMDVFCDYMLLQWHPELSWIFHYTYRVCLCGMCRDQVMKCPFIMMTFIKNVNTHSNLMIHTTPIWECMMFATYHHRIQTRTQRAHTVRVMKGPHNNGY